jgi:hypothetical protein
MSPANASKLGMRAGPQAWKSMNFTTLRRRFGSEWRTHALHAWQAAAPMKRVDFKTSDMKRPQLAHEISPHASHCHVGTLA